MGEITEKIYYCDIGDNNNALAVVILAGSKDDWSPIAAMMGGGMNNWMNNLFAYMMFMALFRNGGFGFGNGDDTSTQGIETQAQLNAIRTQLQDNQNANCIKSAIQGNSFALSQLAQTLNVDKKVYNRDPHDENKVTISIARQAEAGEGKDFTYPTTSSEATGLYQYIDNHIKNFDLIWQILD